MAAAAREIPVVSLNLYEHCARDERRRSDRLFRWGGDDFLLFVSCRKEEAQRAASRLTLPGEAAASGTTDANNRFVRFPRIRSSPSRRECRAVRQYIWYSIQ